MKVKIQVVVESDNGDTQVVQEVVQIERGFLQPENLGLTLTGVQPGYRYRWRIPQTAKLNRLVQ